MTLDQLQWIVSAFAFVAVPVAALFLIEFAARSRLLRCPETGSVAFVDAIQWAQDERGGAAVRRCDLWPQEQGCAQGCLARFEETVPGCRVRLEALRPFSRS